MLVGLKFMTEIMSTAFRFSICTKCLCKCACVLCFYVTLRKSKAWVNIFQIRICSFCVVLQEIVSIQVDHVRVSPVTWSKPIYANTVPWTPSTIYRQSVFSSCCQTLDASLVHTNNSIMLSCYIVLSVASSQFAYTSIISLPIW